jgi:hypothetical protein
MLINLFKHFFYHLLKTLEKLLKNQVKLVLNKTLDSIEFFITFPEVIYHSIV